MSRKLSGMGGLATLLFAPTVLALLPEFALAQASPFLTGANSLQSNILAWLTPVAIILIMVLGGMTMANRIVQNCGNTHILRCSASEGGDTARFASKLTQQAGVGPFVRVDLGVPGDIAQLTLMAWSIFVG